MQIAGVPIEKTFAEAFSVTAARVIVTAINPVWAQTAATVVTGYATSVIACDAEAGIERFLDPHETPDGRPGVSLLFFAFSRGSLEKTLINRIGQCILTCPTTAAFNGLPIDPARSLRIGGNLRYFGDGWQISKKIDNRRYWRIPTMDGEFLCEDHFGSTKAVAGGNFLILGSSQESALFAAERAVAAMRTLPEIIMPFPGGIVRSGSKVGSKYPKLKASTNDAWCPTLRGSVRSDIPAGVNAVYEIVIDGLNVEAVRTAMRLGIQETCQHPGVSAISAGNYGGKLGQHPIHLHDLFGGSS